MTFKVGDRVRVKDDAFQYAAWANGKTGRIVEYFGTDNLFLLDEEASGITVGFNQIESVETEFKVGQTVRISFPAPKPVEGKITRVSPNGIILDDTFYYTKSGTTLSIEILEEPLPEIPAGCKGVLINGKSFYRYTPDASATYPFVGYDIKSLLDMGTIEFLVAP